MFFTPEYCFNAATFLDCADRFKDHFNTEDSSVVTKLFIPAGIIQLINASYHSKNTYARKDWEGVSPKSVQKYTRGEGYLKSVRIYIIFLALNHS